jgi:hypothetical protein
MVMRIIWLIFGLIFISFAEPAISQGEPQLPCGYADKECAAKARHGHIVTKLDYWNAAFAKPLDQRIGAAPPELVEYLNLDNIQNGYPNKPHTAALPADFLADVQQAFSELPAEVKRLLSAKLAGIYFVEDLGGTGYSEAIADKSGKPIAGLLVLDRAALADRTANAWSTWKENTPFEAQPNFRLVSEIEFPKQDNRKNAIQYILLHELAHILAVGEKIHPPWDIEPKNVQSTSDYPFFLLSWAIAKEDNRYVTLFDSAFPQRKDVVYYFGAKLPADQMVDTYANLERTNFSTLYSVVRPGDDFAEAFANYVHVVLMKKPFAIRIYIDGKIAKIYASCWDQQRCTEKRKLLERFLNET